VTAVADGDLSQKFGEAGEIAALADTINNMTESLDLADQVSTVARRWASVASWRAGQGYRCRRYWRELTDNVNLLAGNLTNQVRNIADYDRRRHSDLSKITVKEGDPRAEEHHQRDGRTAPHLRRRGYLASLAKSIRTASSVGRPRSRSAGTGKTSPTTST
jgi:hypothetical protein